MGVADLEGARPLAGMRDGDPRREHHRLGLLPADQRLDEEAGRVSGTGVASSCGRASQAQRGGPVPDAVLSHGLTSPGMPA